jgi:glycosyltransferase involved in cell wall biosynthesis
MTADDRLHVLFATNRVRDERFGASKVPLRIAGELAKLDVDVRSIFAEDLFQLSSARAAQLTAPFRVALAVMRAAKGATVIDIGGGDAWVYALWARSQRRRAAIVARSDGLWCRSLRFKGIEHHGWRRSASRIVQGEICRWERASIKRSDLAIFCTKSDANFVVDAGWKRRDQVAVINLGVDEAFASNVPLDSRAGVFYVGTFMHQKGGDVAAAALNRVLTRHPEATATFVGPGVPPEEILLHFDAVALPRVRLVDRVPAIQVAREIAGGAVFVFPSLYEGFGMVLIEAMRAGLAVVSTPAGAGAEVIRDGENGLIVPISDVTATAAAVERLLADSSLRTRLARAGIEEAQKRSWNAIATQFIEAYRRAISVVRGGS